MSDDDFAPIWDEGVLLAEHEAVRASVEIGGWLSAALDDPNVCDAMKADINRWFSAGFLYLDAVRQIIEADRAELVAEIVAWLREEAKLCNCYARSSSECACGAWDDWKTVALPPLIDEIEAKWGKK